MREPLPRDPDPLLATCARCHETADVTIEDALRTGWAVIESELTCPDELTPCETCSTPCLLAEDGCVGGGHHCPACAQTCRACGLYESQEREPYDD